MHVATESLKGYQMLLNIYRFVNLIYFVHAIDNVINCIFKNYIYPVFNFVYFTRVVTLIITHIKFRVIIDEKRIGTSNNWNIFLCLPEAFVRLML